LGADDKYLSVSIFDMARSIQHASA
jgi:hypothetical protein